MVPKSTAPSIPSLASPAPLDGALRLSPIEHPKSWLVRLFNWLARRVMGKTMTPAKVIYARMPALLLRSLPLLHLMDRGLSLERELKLLIEVHVASVNGCAFCHDAHLAQAVRQRVSRDKLKALDLPPEQRGALSARERAALRYVEEIARGGASDASFGELRACFSEEEIVEITWLQAFATYLLRMAKPLGIGSDGFCALQGGG